MIASRLDGREVPAVHGEPSMARGRSAVLVGLYESAGEVVVILTRRSAQLRSHTLEISFPGGREDPSDADLWQTAVREAHEEVDLDPSLVHKLGELDRFVTVGSESLIHPFVARVERRPTLTAQPEEVDQILEVSMAELLLDEVWREEIWQIGNATRAITFFELHGNTVWGATASILRQFLTLATATDDLTQQERFG